MQSRILSKGVTPSKVVAVPLWSQEIQFDAAGRNRFRADHQIEKKFVVMYSGNHSPCHPLGSLLKAAAWFAHDPAIVFCFVGGGSEFRKLQLLQRRTRCPSILCLPYQPLAQLSGSLSAADLHIIVMGENLVGLVHPCKVYNLLNLGIPILYIGPQPSPVTQLLSLSGKIVRRELSEPSSGSGATALQSTASELQRHRTRTLHSQARHGEVESIIQHIRSARQQGEEIGRSETWDRRSQFFRASIMPRLLVHLENIPAGARNLSCL
jgi:hypothetical protein